MKIDDSRFSNVPVEEDTIIKKQAVISVGVQKALHQKWVWEGIVAESLVFITKEVDGLSDLELEELVLATGLVMTESQFTISRNNDGYTLVNFNFENPM